MDQLRPWARSERRGRGLHWRTDMSKPFDMELFLAGVLTGSHATRQRHLKLQIAGSERQRGPGRESTWLGFLSIA